MAAQWDNPRDIVERVYIRGQLVLETPAHFGSGDSDGLLDLSLMRDPYSGGILLTGSTLAGALRGYLIGLGSGYATKARRLFGEVDRTQAIESWLIVEDSVCESPELESRDGVAISPITGTAVKQAKYDFELLSAATIFDIGFELLVPKENGDELVETFARALLGLQEGHIRLGKRKRRGFGRCNVSGWNIQRFSVNNPEGMFRWLETWPVPRGAYDPAPIDQLLLQRSLGAIQPESVCTLKAVFSLTSPLNIRSTPAVAWDRAGAKVDPTPDTMHLHSKRAGGLQPVISGTSLAGALRARTVRIANVLGLDGNALADSVFGNHKTDKSAEPEASDWAQGSRTYPQKQKWTASRLWVDEAEVTGPLETELVQSRLMIDRFTGGAFSGALLHEQPLFPLNGNRFSLSLRLQLEQFEKDGEQVDRTGDIGLLLLLLKDLWDGYLTLGGESGVGRGRCKGVSARLSYGTESWTITAGESGALVVEGKRGWLEEFVAAFGRGE